MSLTPHHAKYFAYDLTRRAANGMDRLSMSLFDAAVDLNPHQIEAALFALQSPLSKGVILADEVGLGKTIEAGIVLCQLWAERKRQLIVICPASIRKQWALELSEKFNLPAVVLDAKAYREAKRGSTDPLSLGAVLIMSLHFANTLREELKARAWDLVVIDEAHKLRNAYRPSNKVGQGIRWATEDCRKLLLTATPLQNSLLELYGLSTLIDEHLFGDVNSFRSQYASAGSNLDSLRQRLSGFCKRTLRNQVTEYIRYTERRPITRPFKPTDDEHALYEAVSGFLQRDNSYALPQRQRHLMALILRKLLASSSQAIAATLDTLRARLETLRDERAQSAPQSDAQFTEQIIEAEDIEGDLLDEILSDDEESEGVEAPPVTIDRQKLREEIDILQRLATWARTIGVDTKSQTLLKALEIDFEQMTTTGAARKALIFTESRRTQDYLKKHLELNGYRRQVVLAIEQAQSLGADAETLPKVKELRARLKTDTVDVGTLESEVYDHLFSFFRRYYSEGDFLSRRVYKPGVYAIPYEGEHGNVKAAEGKDRVFILAAGGESGRDFIAEDPGEQGPELSLRFEYRPATLTDWPEDVRDGKSKPPAQKDLSALAANRVLAVNDAALAPWTLELGKPHVTASGEKADYTRIEAHLRRYTARNTFDYFIHKDLGGFLRRELDFYIKNEVMHLDDVENETAPRVEQYLSKIKIIRKIAGKIIAFLAQLEDFQKKLWLKKKFVVETQWCIRVGCIPAAFRAEIATNDAQREEWVKLYGLNIPSPLSPLSPLWGELQGEGFLNAHPTLVVDTRHSDAGFAARLLEAVGDVDAQTDGVLFHSENFQALSVMQVRYREQTCCAFNDPPHNTGVDGFPYKDAYEHSSWLSMIEGRLSLVRSLLSQVVITAASQSRNPEVAI